MIKKTVVIVSRIINSTSRKPHIAIFARLNNILIPGILCTHSSLSSIVHVSDNGYLTEEETNFSGSISTAIKSTCYSMRMIIPYYYSPGLEDKNYQQVKFKFNKGFSYWLCIIPSYCLKEENIDYDTIENYYDPSNLGRVSILKLKIPIRLNKLVKSEYTKVRDFNTELIDPYFGFDYDNDDYNYIEYE